MLVDSRTLARARHRSVVPPGSSPSSRPAAPFLPSRVRDAAVRAGVVRTLRRRRERAPRGKAARVVDHGDARGRGGDRFFSHAEPIGAPARGAIDRKSGALRTTLASLRLEARRDRRRALLRVGGGDSSLSSRRRRRRRGVFVFIRRRGVRSRRRLRRVAARGLVIPVPAVAVAPVVAVVGIVGVPVVVRIPPSPSPTVPSALPPASVLRPSCFFRFELDVLLLLAERRVGVGPRRGFALAGLGSRDGGVGVGRPRGEGWRWGLGVGGTGGGVLRGWGVRVLRRHEGSGARRRRRRGGEDRQDGDERRGARDSAHRAVRSEDRRERRVRARRECGAVATRVSEEGRGASQKTLFRVFRRTASETHRRRSGPSAGR